MLLQLVVFLGIIFPSIQASEDVATIPRVIENRLIEMENKFDSLISKRNNEMETILKALMKDHISLKTKFEKLDSEHVALKHEMANLRQQNENLKKRVFKLQNDSFRNPEKTFCKCETLANSLTKTQKQNKKGMYLEKIEPGFDGKLSVHGKREKGIQKQNISTSNDYDLSEKAPFLSKRRTMKTGQHQSTQIIPSSARVAFFAKMSSDLTNPGDNQHIEFSNVMTNVGNAYNGASSTFVCPVAGTYVFFASILSRPNKIIQTVIVRNNNGLSYTYSFSGDHFNSGSNMAVIDLQVNDRVWVRVDGIYHDTGNVASISYSTFSGFILWENQ